MKHNPFVWVEIPVSDMQRAIGFYEKVFQFTLKPVDFGGLKMAWFPSAGDDKPGATGTLIQQESYIPSSEGALLYFFSEDVSQELSRVAAAGGSIYQEKTQISPEHGYFGVFIDSEGNRIALHSAQ